MKKGAFWMVLIAAFVFSRNDAACQVITLNTGWYHVGNADPHESKRCAAPQTKSGFEKIIARLKESRD